MRCINLASLLFLLIGVLIAGVLTVFGYSTLMSWATIHMDRLFPQSPQAGVVAGLLAPAIPVGIAAAMAPIGIVFRRLLPLTCFVWWLTAWFAVSDQIGYWNNRGTLDAMGLRAFLEFPEYVHLAIWPTIVFVFAAAPGAYIAVTRMVLTQDRRAPFMLRATAAAALVQFLCIGLWIEQGYIEHNKLAPTLPLLAIGAAIVGIFVMLSTLSFREFSGVVKSESDKSRTKLANGTLIPAVELLKRYPYKEGGIITGMAFDPKDYKGRIATTTATAQFMGFHGNGHLITFAGTGGGKSISAITNLLTCRYSFLVNDTKPELYAKTRKVRESWGRRCYQFNPESPRTCSINLLARIDTTDRLKFSLAVDRIMNGLEPAKKQGEDDTWIEVGRKLVRTLLVYMLLTEDFTPEEKTLRLLAQLMGDGIADVLKAIISQGPDFGFGMTYAPAGNLLAQAQGGGDTWGSVTMAADRFVSWLNNDAYATLVCATGPEDRRVSLDLVLDPQADIFISVSDEIIQAAPQLARCLWGAFISRIMEHGRAAAAYADDPENNPKVLPIKHRIVALIDEISGLGKLKAITDARDRGRSYGITLWTFWQSPGQVKGAWGNDELQSWIDSADVQTYLWVKNGDTAKEISVIAGETQIEVEQHSENQGDSHKFGDVFGNKSTGKSRSVSLQKVATLPPEDILQLPKDDDGISAGAQIVVYPGEPPCRCGIPKYFRRKELMAALKQFEAA